MRNLKTLSVAGGVSAIIILSFVLQLRTIDSVSPVNDEPANIPSGYTFLLTGKYEDSTHPPLARMLFAIPLFFISPDPMPDHPSLEVDWHRYGRDFIFRNRVPASHIITATRAVNITLACLLGLLVFFWSRKLWGYPGAFLSLACFAFEPTVLGHGSLATVDMAASLGIFLASFLYMRYRQAPSKARFLGFALALAAAPLLKFSGIIALLSVLASGRLARRVVAVRLPWRLRTRLAIMAGMFVLLCATLYQFEVRSLSEDPQITTTRESAKIADGIGEFSSRFGLSQETVMETGIPLYTFLKGFSLQIFHSMLQESWEDADFYQYLWGQYSRSGWFYYFPSTFLLKTTVPMLAMLLIALWLGVTRVWKEKWATISSPLFIYAMPPFAVYLLFSLTTTINIGHRYILPLYPFLALFVGALGRTDGLTEIRRRVFVTTAALLTVAHVVLSISAFPNYIAYFNELAGGRENGWKYLADSNIDWGQDLYLLAQDVTDKRRSDPTGNAIYYGNLFGTVRPSDVGVDLRDVPAQGIECGEERITLYLSINRYLLRSVKHPEGLYPWLGPIQPCSSHTSAHAPGCASPRIPFDRILGSSIVVWDDYCAAL